jgi:GNAT superfamily N-acetyltransferase
LDDAPVWSIVCFVIGKPYRRGGLSEKLLRAAADHARDRGARLLEGYPYEPTQELTGYSGYMGIRSVFDRVGFREIGRTGHQRPVMRLEP